MKEMTTEEIAQVGGGVRWDEVGAGLGAAALAIGIVASGPVGWVGLAAAGALGYGGGVAIGDGLAEGHIFDF